MDMLNKDTSSKESKTIDANTRRTFLKKASIGAPIIIASSSKPAWGVQCMSGIMSGNISNHVHTCNLTSNNAQSASYWKNKYVGYYMDYHSKTKAQECQILGISSRKFDRKRDKYYYWDQYSNKPVFAGGIKKSSFMGDKTMDALLQAFDRFEQEISAARLNAAICAKDPNCINYPYTINDVDQIFLEVSVMTDPNKVNEVADMLKEIRTS